MNRMPITIRMSHVRQSKMCASGARAFFARYELDWSLFLKEGISSSLLEATNDAMALKVVEIAYGKQ